MSSNRVIGYVPPTVRSRRRHNPIILDPYTIRSFPLYPATWIAIGHAFDLYGGSHFQLSPWDWFTEQTPAPLIYLRMLDHLTDAGVMTPAPDLGPDQLTLPATISVTYSTTDGYVHWSWSTETPPGGSPSDLVGCWTLHAAPHHRGLDVTAGYGSLFRSSASMTVGQTFPPEQPMIGLFVMSAGTPPYSRTSPMRWFSIPLS